MLIVGAVSQKGGAGKTTLCVHLAVEATQRGMKTILIDLDPQGNATKWGARRADMPPDVSAESPAALESALKGAERQDYEIVILDTAPNADSVALQAAKAASLVMVPCRPSQFDLEAIRTTLELCELAKRRALVVLNAAPIRSRVVGEAEDAVRKWGGEVCPIVVRERVAFRHCIPAGQVAAEFEPGGSAAYEIAALFDYMTTPEHAGTSTRRHVGKGA
jgi:chromosome partitioning protein